MTGQNPGLETYQSSGILLKNDDCLKFLSGIKSDSIDHIQIDPPYFIGYDGGKGWDKQWATESVYIGWCAKWSVECARVLKPGRMMIVWGTTKTDTFYRYKLEVLNNIEGMVSQPAIVWSYNWGGRTKTNFAHKNETAWCYSKGDKFLFNPVFVERKMKTNIRTGKPYENGTIPTTIWEGNLATTSIESKESKFHPTVKPQFVLQRMISAYTNPGDTVLDCFSGSGSTMLASVSTGRKFVGCERDPEYFEKSIERVKKNGVSDFF